MLNLPFALIVAVVLGTLSFLISEGMTAGFRRGEAAFRRADFLQNPVKRKGSFFVFLLLGIAGTLPPLYHFQTGALFWWSLLLLFPLLILTFIDLKTFFLPDLITLPLIALGLLQAYALGDQHGLKLSIFGAACGYGSLWLVNTLFRLLRGKEGMGYGDFKLFAALGAWLGPFLLPLVIVIAASFGIVFALLRAAIVRENLSQPFPFGPALALGGYVCWLYGADIFGWYTGLLR